MINFLFFCLTSLALWSIFNSWVMAEVGIHGIFVTNDTTISGFPWRRFNICFCSGNDKNDPMLVTFSLSPATNSMRVFCSTSWGLKVSFLQSNYFKGMSWTPTISMTSCAHLWLSTILNEFKWQFLAIVGSYIPYPWWHWEFHYQTIHCCHHLSLLHQ